MLENRGMRGTWHPSVWWVRHRQQPGPAISNAARPPGPRHACHATPRTIKPRWMQSRRAQFPIRPPCATPHLDPSPLESGAAAGGEDPTGLGWVEGHGLHHLPSKQLDARLACKLHGMRQGECKSRACGLARPSLKPDLWGPHSRAAQQQRASSDELELPNASASQIRFRAPACRRWLCQL